MREASELHSGRHSGGRRRRGVVGLVGALLAAGGVGVAATVGHLPQSLTDVLSRSDIETVTAGGPAEEPPPGSDSADHASSPPPLPPPCPENMTTPSAATGGYCGPEPVAGNGLGPDGQCTGDEAAPPCGPGAEPDRYYAYTWANSCDGWVIFDGRRWQSQLLPPADAGHDTRYVWMRIDSAGRVGLISPTAVVGFDPDTGQPTPDCA